MDLHFRKFKIRNFLFYLFFLFIFFEITSYFFLKSILKDEIYFKDFEQKKKLIQKDKKILFDYYNSQNYSKYLGWDNSSDPRVNSLLARNDETNEKKKKEIIAYGSSFCWGDGLKNDETWPHYLSNLRNTYVANYGVGGYSFYQSFLKFKNKNTGNENTKIVILSIFESEIDRLRSLYEKFYFSSSHRIRPIPLIQNDNLNSTNLPNFEKKQVDKELILFLEKNKDLDYWWDRRLNKEYLFSIKLISFFIMIIEDKFEHGLLFKKNKNNWNDKQTNSLFLKISEEFSDIAKKRNLIPVILVLPRLRNKLADGYKYQKILEEIKKKNIKVFDFSEYSNNFNLKNNRMTVLEDGHFTGYTNQKISQFLNLKIKKTILQE